MRRPFSEAAAVEYFHLTFLQVLQVRLDQAAYVLKGGASLRYFFESLRYSEDIDLDANRIEPWKLEEKVDEVLASTATELLLRRGGLDIRMVNKPKQTPTTQRWTVQIQSGERTASVRTRIEFSHRGADPRRILEAVPTRVVEPYAMRAPTMQHYTADAAIEQKIFALAQRSETQARDIFDLDLLLRQHHEPATAEGIDESTLEAAYDRTFELTKTAFQNQVLPFLDQDIADLYQDPASWEEMQTFVAQRLQEMQR